VASLEDLGQKLRSVAVIGAGWAGCAAAVELAKNGHQVTLIEAARIVGGRARRVEQHGLPLDNGQHILLGAYRDTLRLMRTVGLNPEQSLLRLPLQMRYPPASDGMDFLAPRLPAPLHVAWALLRARGLERDDKLALMRFSSAARWMDWQLDIDCSVSELLERFEQTARLIQLMWRPLCLAALNTPPERASAKVFLNVLRDSLGAKRAASDMLLPTVDLSVLFPDAAVRYVEAHGGSVRLGVHVRAIERSGQGWQVDGSEFDELILATPSWITADLLAPHDAALAAMSFEQEPITTCYLQYPSTLKLAIPFYALIDAPQSEQWGQFVFDRGQLNDAQAGLLAVVVSASSEASALSHSKLAAAICLQLAEALDLPELNQPLWSSVITEKRATFSCTPDLQRPSNRTAQQGLWIAGDYTEGDYPATIEGAVRSGLQAARLLITHAP
jgi:squalene-associated FAD-dependent desaturase